MPAAGDDSKPAATASDSSSSSPSSSSSASPGSDDKSVRRWDIATGKEVARSDIHRDLMVIPAFVYHAHQNIGLTDALFISMPSRPYDHQSPDVYRFPLDTDQIPYRFEDRKGW